MAPRSKEQFATIRLKSREAILDAALHLFARRGYGETTMEEIAKRAGISKGLIYNHFASKIVILESLVMEVIQHRLPMLTEIPPKGAPAKSLETLIRMWIHFIKTEPELVRLFQQIHGSGHLAKVLVRRHGKLYEDVLKSVTKIFERRNSPTPFVDAALLGSIMDGIGLNYTAAPDLFPIDKMEKRLVELFASTEP